MKDLTPAWKQTDEWYVFYDSPAANGFNILYSIDGEKINPGGNILFVKDKNFGMGKNHPVTWYRTTGKGLVMYTSIGHDDAAWKQPAFIQLLETAVKQTDAK